MDEQTITNELAAALAQDVATGRGLGGDEPASPGVLVVGKASALEELVRLALKRVGMSRPVQRVEGYLTALAAIASSAADGVPAAIVGRLDGLEGALAPMVAAIRQVAPRVRLVLLAPPQREPEAIAALEAGFDSYLIEPVEPAQLGRELKVLERHPAPPPMGLSRAAESALASLASEFSISKPEVAPPTAPAPPATTASSIRPSIAPSPVAPPPAHTLGDVDLVDQILHARGSALRDTALRLIAQHAGFEVAFAPTAKDVPADHLVSSVEFAGQSFGMLHAPPPAAVHTLAAWALWLARWLALDQRMNQLWEMALRDELTGVWNRRYFNRFLKSILDMAASQRFSVTLMVFDIDDFKTYNDRYGHAAGDEILRESARLMRSVVRDHDVVARIGGDEFAVIFWDAHGPRKPNSSHPADVRMIAKRFQAAICAHKFPKLLDEAPGTLTISGGLATFPWDGRTPDELWQCADEMALQSKRQGKNALTFGRSTMA